jgi:hypothetical protein
LIRYFLCLLCIPGEDSCDGCARVRKTLTHLRDTIIRSTNEAFETGISESKGGSLGDYSRRRKYFPKRTLKPTHTPTDHKTMFRLFSPSDANPKERWRRRRGPWQSCAMILSNATIFLVRPCGSRKCETELLHSSPWLEDASATYLFFGSIVALWQTKLGPPGSPLFFVLA